MIDDIRKKHETNKSKFGRMPAEWSTLTISDVDALFAALDTDRGKAKIAIAYVEDVLIMVKAALDEAQKKIEKQWVLIDFYDAKVFKALKIAKMRSKHPATMTNYYLEHIEEIEQILTEEG